MTKGNKQCEHQRHINGYIYTRFTSTQQCISKKGHVIVWVIYMRKNILF